MPDRKPEADAPLDTVRWLLPPDGPVRRRSFACRTGDAETGLRITEKSGPVIVVIR